MTNRSKRIGDQAEREVCKLLNELLGVPARRAFGAGRGLDEGDVVGVPRTTIQVSAAKARFVEAVKLKPLSAELERQNATNEFAATFLRVGPNDYRVVLTPAQWAALWREATA